MNPPWTAPAYPGPTVGSTWLKRRPAWLHLPLGLERLPILQLLRMLRWALPLSITVVVAVQVVLETSLFVYPEFRLRHLVANFTVYGVVGPLFVALVLDWLRRQLETEERLQRQVEEQIRQLNRELEEKVAARTGSLREAHSRLEDTNRRLRRAVRELRELDRLKSEFVSMVSHELRAPLTNINASVELLLQREEPGDSSDREMLLIIGEQSARLTRLVQGVLSVSRIEAGVPLLNAGALELEPLLTRAVKSVEISTDRHHFRVEVAPDLPPVSADPDRILEVLLNLLDNAVKYSPNGGVIRLSARAMEGLAQIEVRDPGRGIPRREQQRIFKKFYRVDRGDSRETYGYGLGLYIVRRLVEAHGGRVWVHSAPGRGSTFGFSLPVVREVPEPV